MSHFGSVGAPKESHFKEGMDDDPINIQQLVDERIKCRQQREYARSDEIRTLLLHHLIRVIDAPGGGATWEKIDPPTTTTTQQQNTLSILKTVQSNAMLHKGSPQYINMHALIQSDLNQPPLSRELQGRKCADVAFHLALAGYDCADTFSLLLQGAMDEINRCHQRVRFRPYDMIVMCEKFATAGIRGNDESCPLGGAFFTRVVEISQLKIKAAAAAKATTQFAQSLADISRPSYSLLSHRPLLSLFRYSARQKKCGKQVKTSSTTTTTTSTTSSSSSSSSSTDGSPTPFNLATLFKNPNLPLIVDVGCGWGTTMLGLASSSSFAASYNYLGIDMSLKCIRYASSISKRWNISHRCQFIASSVDEVVVCLKEYPGGVHTFFVQFPTPYRIQEFSKTLKQNNDSTESSGGSKSESGSGGGNTQLPNMEEFMVTPWLLCSMEELLVSSNDKVLGGGGIYIQSNAEDVAVTMEHLIEQHCPLLCRRNGESNNANEVDEDRSSLPVKAVDAVTRHSKYLRMIKDHTLNGSTTSGIASTSSWMRATGPHWLTTSPYAANGGLTETEAMCQLEQKPLYRQFWGKKPSLVLAQPKRKNGGGGGGGGGGNVPPSKMRKTSQSL